MQDQEKTEVIHQNEVRKGEIRVAIERAKNQLTSLQEKVEELRKAGYSETENLDTQKTFESELFLSQKYTELFDEGGIGDLKGRQLLEFLENELGSSGVSKKRSVEEQIQYFIDERKETDATIARMREEGFKERSSEQRTFDELPALISFLESAISSFQAELDTL